MIAGITQAWTYRYTLTNLDGVSYLDVADAWRLAGWRAAANGYWSPAYSWILAAAMGILHPKPAAEYALVHAVNLVMYLAAFAACVLLVREMTIDGNVEHDQGIAWSPNQLAIVSLLLFVWIALTQLVIPMESPDLIVAAATFVASAMLLRLERRWSAGSATAFGLSLGAAYLTKAAMLPLGVVYLVAGCIFARARLRTAVVSCVMFALTAGPWIAAVSVAKGRLDWGDAGRLNYLWFVNRSEDWPRHWPPHWPHWDGEGSLGTQLHPAARLLDRPAVYSFAREPRQTGAHGGFEPTYAMWEDPSYWYEGLRARPNPRDELRRLKLSASDLFTMFVVNDYRRDLFNPQIAIAAVLAVCALAARRFRFRLHWALLLPAILTIAAYAAVYVEPRYIGGAVTVVWIVVLGSLRLPARASSARLLRSGAVVATVVLLVAIVSTLVAECSDGWRRMLRGEADETNLPWHVAALVHGAGVSEGEHVAIVGNAQAASRWARLARVKIVAEIPAADVPVFAGDPAAAAQALRVLPASGARFVLAEQVPGGMAGWQQLTGTPYWLERLQ